jgi:superfamily I DNA and/or RNA helicase
VKAKKRLTKYDVLIMTVPSSMLNYLLMIQHGMLHTEHFIDILRDTNGLELSELVAEEASQLPLFSMFTTLSIFPTIKRIVLVGDMKQLAPYGTTLTYEVKSVMDASKSMSTHVELQRQYRMPSGISNIIGSVNYGGALDSEPAKTTSLRECLRWFDVTGLEEQSTDMSWFNSAESACVAKIVNHLINDGFPPSAIGVISGYTAQLREVRNALGELGCECGTVDSYQGKEKDVIIVSLVRTEKPGIFADRKRANVALTRMRKRLFLIGDVEFWEQQAEVCPLICEFALKTKQERLVCRA